MLIASGTSADFVDIQVPAWAWVALLAFIVTLLLVDLLVIHRVPHEVSTREAAIESAVWIGIGLSFTAVMWWAFGTGAAGEYLSGYLIEESLSIDNVFVWALILAYFAVPRQYQHRVLFWGIFGALILRATFIFAGIALIQRFELILIFFGAFLLYTAWKLVTSDDQMVDPDNSRILKVVRRIVPSTTEYDEAQAVHEGRRAPAGHAALRRPAPRRGDRRRVRGRLGPGGAGRQPRAVHRLLVERVRHPRALRAFTSCSPGCTPGSRTCSRGWP